MSKEKKHVPPYMPYATLKSTVETFAESTVPTVLNRHVLSTMSGAAYGSLISGLKFLGLLNDDDSPKEEFAELVKARRAGEASYQEKLRIALDNAYGEIVKGIDIHRGTLPEIEKAFRDAGSSPGQPLVKAVRFYVKAMEDCGVKVSPHIKKPRRPTLKNAKTPPKRKRETKAERIEEKPSPSPTKLSDDESETSPQGFSRLPILGRDNAYIQYPTSLTKEDCRVIEAAVQYLRVLVLPPTIKKEESQ